MPNDHYYTQHPTSAHKAGEVSWEYRGFPLTFETDSGVFSRTEIDEGTELLLRCLPEEMAGTVLDMGCGYGVMGIAIGKAFPGCHVTMSDINERAVSLSEKNARRNGVTARALQGDGYAALTGEKFATIVQNPPIRAGKAVIYSMFRDAADCLEEGGALWLVIRKQQGAPSALTFLQTLYRDATVTEKKHGFWILRCSDPIRKEGEMPHDL